MLEPVLSKEKPYKFPEPPSGCWEAEGSVSTCSIPCQLVPNDQFPTARKQDGFESRGLEEARLCEVQTYAHS